MNFSPLVVLILFAFTSTCYSQVDEDYWSKVYMKNDNKKIIVSVRPLRSGENPDPLPLESKLYSIPVNCDNLVELSPCHNFEWISNTLFYGEKHNKREVYIYNNDGSLLRKIENAVLFSPILGRAIFVREYITWDKRINPQVILYTPEHDKEEILIEFDKEKYTFHEPNNGGVIYKFDYYFGGYRGVVLSTDWSNEEVYTFVIDAKDKKMTFWLDKIWIDTDIRHAVPEEGIIKNGN